MTLLACTIAALCVGLYGLAQIIAMAQRANMMRSLRSIDDTLRRQYDQTHNVVVPHLITIGTAVVDTEIRANNIELSNHGLYEQVMMIRQMLEGSKP